MGWNSITYTGINATTNVTANLSVSGSYFCVSNSTLAEGLCGSWVTQNFGGNYNNNYFIATFNCSALNNATGNFACLGGRCQVVTTPGQNNTNLSLPDLIIFNVTLSSINYTNVTGTNQTNATFGATAFVRNIGN